MVDKYVILQRNSCLLATYVVNKNFTSINSLIIKMFNPNKIDLVKLPNGNITNLDKLEKVYLIAQEYAKKEDINFAIFGKPTAPVFQPIIDAQIEYWTSLDKTVAVEYGELEGQQEYRARMSSSINRLYDLSGDLTYQASDIYFTSGGRIAIQAISYLIRKLFANKKVVTTSFFYPDHTGVSYANDTTHDLLLVDVSSEYKGLCAATLWETLENVDKNEIGAFIFSDPNNPSGDVVGAEEWKKMIEIFKQYPGVPIIIDEAYAEMVFDATHESLISIAPREIQDQIILLRSATKGFSVSGERMAILVTKNQTFMNLIMEYHSANLVHCPKSVQNAYTYAMEQFDGQKQIKLASFYKPIVRKIEKTLVEAGLEIKHPNYGPRAATFYVLADFSSFLGQELNADACEYYVEDKKFIENNIDLAMHILFEFKLALMPLCFFGADLDSGILRITCSFDQAELEEVCLKLSQIGVAIKEINTAVEM